MTIYLYKKTHAITGLQYLGKTSRNPFDYKGSGKYWLNHLKIHGVAHSTEILKECESNDEVKIWGLYYSDLWDIVNSSEWANLVREEGSGGRVVYGPNHHMKTSKYKKLIQDIWTPEKRAATAAKSIITNSKVDKAKLHDKLSNAFTDERRQKLVARLRGNSNPSKDSSRRKYMQEHTIFKSPEFIEKHAGDNHYMRNNGTKKTGIHHQRYDPTIYSFLNVKTGEQYTGSSYEFRMKYCLNQGNIGSLISGNRKSVLGWRIQD